MVEKLNNYIRFEEIQFETFKNIFVIGNIGNGKSTLLNKIRYFLSKQENDKFIAKK